MLLAESVTSRCEKNNSLANRNIKEIAQKDFGLLDNLFHERNSTHDNADQTIMPESLIDHSPK